VALPSFCPLCSSDSAAQVVESRVVAGGSPQHAVFRCQVCDVRYLWPRLDPDDEERFYREEFAGFMQEREGGGHQAPDPTAHRERNEPLRQERMSRLSSFLPSAGSILEVGCASGFMLLPLQDLGLRCVGVEPSGLFQADLKARGLEIYSSLDDLKALKGQEFDLIFHYFVLEHIGDPKDFLRQQIALLSPGGHIVFEVPCGKDALLEVYNLNSFRDFYFQIGHQWIFTPSSLDHLLKDLGVTYTASTRQRYGLANHITWARHGRPGGDVDLNEILGSDLDSEYKDRLVANDTADTLVVVISK